MLKEAQKLRQEATDLASSLPERDESEFESPPPLRRLPSKILVIGSNGRLGKMVVRDILRNLCGPKSPSLNVIAGVHDARRVNSLSYEVGAEDGKGSIGAAWSDQKTATFEWTPEMRGYNLEKLTVRDFELLSPLEVNDVVSSVDCVVFCATDFNGNKPRGISSLDAGLLFRAFRDPLKGRVEVEGIRNCLEALKKKNLKVDYNQFVLASVAEDVFGNFVTPLGDFNSLKREGENLLKEFPSVSSCALRFGYFEDNFVEEGLSLITKESERRREAEADGKASNNRKKINRRDAATAMVKGITETSWRGKCIDIFTTDS